MEEFKSRLLLYLERLGTSQRAFEEDCGIAQGTIASIKVKGPSVDVLMKISNKHQDLNLNWLVSGRGAMLTTQEASVSSHVQNDIHHNDTVNINYGQLKDAIVEAIREAKENA